MVAPTIHDIEKKLDKLYTTDLGQYIEHVKTIKGVGYKVFRNENGRHRVKYDEEALKGFFGGVFG